MRKLVEERQRTRYKALYDALWVDRINPKRAIGMSPFQLLYALNYEIPITVELPTLKLAKAIEDVTYQDSPDKRIMFLSQLEETRAEVVDRIAAYQSQVKVLFDKETTSREFSVGRILKSDLQGSFFSKVIAHQTLKSDVQRFGFILPDWTLKSDL
ncbi:uncharacterized protein LOC131874126 [Cryptomeria japonica]|uniref:uncharacterized protein LOC131874126 n=1 Tax=Cryptomeria japonica TaxID=3369 RepID=UPI0027D9FEB5|nr:uncharacterized protein LOC131874126 [Cryptomeria japonica]